MAVLEGTNNDDPNDPSTTTTGSGVGSFDCAGSSDVDDSHAAFNTNGRGNNDTGYGPSDLIIGDRPGQFRGISRGHIVNRCAQNVDGGLSGVPANKRFKFNFLYNPSALRMNIGVDTSLLPVENQSEFDSASYLGGSQSQRTFDFDLFLDRTFELMGGNNNAEGVSGNLDRDINDLIRFGPTKLGVYYDILYLQRLVGIFERGQPAQFSLVDFYWAKASNPIVWSGYITGININYTHFNPRMIPMRAVVNIQFQERWSANNLTSALANPGQPGSTGGGASGIEVETGIPAAVTNGPGSGNSGTVTRPLPNGV